MLSKTNDLRTLVSSCVNNNNTSLTVIISSNFYFSKKFTLIWYKVFYQFGTVGREFANSSGDLGSIPGRVIPKTLKIVPDTSFLDTQQYKVRIKGKVDQSRERSSALPYT